MGHINVTDEWLYEKMPLIDKAIIQELEEQTDYQYSFSPRFEKKMKKLVHKKKRLSGRLYYFQNAAAACIAIFMGATVIVVSASDIHFFEKIQSALDNMGIYHYSFSTENNLHEAEMKIPGYIPDEYKISYQSIDQYSAVFVYTNNADKELSLNQYLVSDGMAYGFDSEYDWKEEINVAGRNIQIYHYFDGTTRCYMEYRNCIFTLHAFDLNNQDIEHIYAEWIF